MPLIVGNQGEADALEYFVNRAAPQNLVLKLFKNDITPAETDTAATFTEADFVGYASITLTGATWNAPVEGNPSSIDYPQQTFTSSQAQAQQTIFGYFCVRATSGRLTLAERFTNAPFTVANNGDFIRITPKITSG